MKNDHLGALEKDTATGLSARIVRAYDLPGTHMGFLAGYPPIGKERDEFLERFHEETIALVADFRRRLNDASE